MSNNLIASAPSLRSAFEELKALAADTKSMLYYPTHGESGDTGIACALGVGPTIALDSDGTDEWTTKAGWFSGRDDGSHHGKVAIPADLQDTLFQFDGNLFALSLQAYNNGNVLTAENLLQIGAFAANGAVRYSGLQIRMAPSNVPAAYWTKSDGVTELNRSARTADALGSAGTHQTGNFIFLFDYRDGGDGGVTCYQSWERAAGAPAFAVSSSNATTVAAGEGPALNQHDNGGNPPEPLTPVITIGGRYREDNDSWPQPMQQVVAIRRVGFTNFGTTSPGNLSDAIQEMLYNNMVPGHQWYRALREARS